MQADDAPGSACDFLLATRIHYESRRKRPAPPATEPAVHPTPQQHQSPEAQELRAAAFLVETRARREASGRARARRRPTPPQE